MTRSRTSMSWIWSLCGLILLLVAGSNHRPLIEQRAEDQLQIVSPEETTPLVALTTVAFGGFRGLVADLLWIRSDTLQQNGQFFEMVQLAKWITQLEPRAPKVWSYQAWNLAYNISALFPRFEDRWRWVSHGIDLLKQEGLTHNPASASLHWDVAWMYQHKIGMDLDQAHLFYKQQLADEVETLLPTGFLGNAPLPLVQEEGLSSSWHMDVTTMIELDQRFGPLDWRLPETHSLYWSTKGLEHPADPFEQGTLRRIQRQSLLVMMRAGTLIRDPETGHLLTLPRLELIPQVEALYRNEWQRTPESESALLAYQNALTDICLLYTEMGQTAKAYESYESLANLDPDIPPGREAFQTFVGYNLSQDPLELSRVHAMSQVVSLLLLSRDPSLSPIRAQGRVQMARQLHRSYQESRLDTQHHERTGLPPFEVMQRLVSSQNL